MHSSELSGDQRRFLHELLQFGSSCDDLVEKLKLKPWRLGCWMRDRRFRKALAEKLKELRSRRDLDLQFAARDAVIILHDMVRGKIPVEIAKALTCEKTIDLSRYRKPNRRKSRGAAPTPLEDLAHPSLSKERADELLENMEQARKQHTEAPLAEVKPST